MNIKHFPCTGANAESTLCKNSIDLCLDTLTSYNEQKCKTARACVKLAYATCQPSTSDFGYGELSLNGKGCSGSGIPLISAMCLFIAALFHML